MPVRLTILGSGSGGNCAYLETNDTRVLIDVGFSLRQIRTRLASIGRAPEQLTGILITHEHGDHVQGLAAIAKKLQVPVFCNRPTHDALAWQLQSGFRAQVFETGSTFELGSLVVDSFSVPHDAQDPVGFLIRAPGANIGFLTDLGHATKLALERVRRANVLLLEANHDVKMLQDCPHRPWSLKQRILSRHGHLSNEAAAEAAKQIVSSELRHLYLGHLSRECNRPELALGAVSERLEKIGATHLRVEVTSQNAPCPTLVVHESIGVPQIDKPLAQPLGSPSPGLDPATLPVTTAG